MHNLDLLKPAFVFATVVHEGSFRRAARTLGLSPSVVSQSVSALESALGVQLLYRSTRKLTLTEAGEGYFSRIAPSLEHIEQANGHMLEGRSGAVGRLRISAPTVIASRKFAGYLRQYREENPGVSLEVDLSDDLRDAIDDRFDLIVRIAGLDEQIKGAQLMFRTSGIICANSSCAGRVSTPADLADLCWIKTPSMGNALSVLREGNRTPATVSPKDVIVVNSGQLVRELVDAGVGFAVFPDFAIQEALQSSGVVNLLPGCTAGERGFFAIHSARNAKLSIARSFVDGWKAYMAVTCAL